MPTDPNVIQPYPTSPVGTVGTPGIAPKDVSGVPGGFTLFPWLTPILSGVEHAFDSVAGVVGGVGKMAGAAVGAAEGQAGFAQPGAALKHPAAPPETPTQAVLGEAGVKVPGLGIDFNDLGVYLALFLLLLLGVWGMISAAKGA